MDSLLNSDQIKILVCCHKECELPKDDWLLPIHVGAAQSSVQLDMQRDDLVNGEPCDNISEKNPNYCELTALYWAWKNIEKVYPHLEYIGLNHYRRYFAFDQSETKRNYIQRSIEDLKNYQVNRAKLSRALLESKVVVPQQANLKTSVARAFEHAHYSSDLRIVHQVIAEKYPECIGVFNDCMICKDHFYDCNMTILPLSEFKDYCAWLFDILFEVEKRVDFSGYDSYQKRIFGFMSERLFTIWVYYKKYQTHKLNYFVFTEAPKSYPRGIFAWIRHKKSEAKRKLAFWLSRPHNKSKLERYWIVP